MGTVSANIIFPKEIVNNWQKKINLLVTFLEVPSGLLVWKNEAGFEILISSETRNNPYKAHEKGDSELFLYCSRVVASARILEIANFTTSKNYNDGKNENRGMISYIGYPVVWPDKNVFGTLCVLDKKERRYSSKHKQLIQHFRDSIEADLNDMIQDYPGITGISALENINISELSNGTKRLNQLLTVSVENLHSGIIISDAAEMKIKYANPAALKILRTESINFIDRQFDKLAQDRGIFDFQGNLIEYEDLPLIKATKKGSVTNNKEIRIADKKGMDKWAIVNAMPVKDKKGEIVGGIEILQDITISKKVILALKESEDRFRAQYDSYPFPIFTIRRKDGVFVFIDANKAAIKNPFLNTVEIIGNQIELCLKGENQIIDAINRTFESNKGEQFETWFGKENTRVKNYVRLTTGFLPPDSVILIFEDLTEFKKNEQLLEENEIRYRTLFENAGDCIFLLLDKKIIVCNSKTLEVFRCKNEDIIGVKPIVFFPEKQPDGSNSNKKANEYISLALSGKPQRFEWIIKRKDNTTFPVETTLNSFQIKNDKFILVILRDITERKYKQKETLKAVVAAEEEERSRIARDLHDGISPILSTVKLLSQSMINCKDEDLQNQLIHKIENTVQEAIISLSEISNKLSPHILLNFGVSEAIKNFINRISATKEIKFNYKSSLKDRLDENIEITLYRAVIELINNTIKYARATRIDISLSENADVLLKYADNGKGFNYNKVMKKKKGMGLFNLKTRIESVNGTYFLDSKPGRGVRIEITIPRHG